MIDEYSAPPIPDEHQPQARWQKRPPMPAVPPRRRKREQIQTQAEIIEAARYELARAKRKGLVNHRIEEPIEP